MTNNFTFSNYPIIKENNLNYLNKGLKKTYVNLFEINFNNNLIFFEYPFQISPKILSNKILKSILNANKNEINKIYGNFLYNNNSLFSFKKISEKKEFLVNYNNNEYLIKFEKFNKSFELNKNSIFDSKIHKQMVEYIFREIINSNNDIEFYNEGNFFVNYNKNYKQEIRGINFAMDLYPGFITSLINTNDGNYLCVNLKNKILGKETVLDYIKNPKNNIKNLIGKTFKVKYNKRTYKIHDISLDINPSNQEITLNNTNESINLIKYYKKTYNIDIKDKKQPLIVVKTRNYILNENVYLFFIPEISYLTEVNKPEIKDKTFSSNLSKLTKTSVNKKIKKTNELMDLIFNKKTERKKNLYGIDIKPISKLYDSYYIKDVELKDGNNEIIKDNDISKIKLVDTKELNNWILVHENTEEGINQANNLYKTLKLVSYEINMEINEPEMLGINPKCQKEIYINQVLEKINQNNHKFVLFLLNKKQENFYSDIKSISLNDDKFLSQVVKASKIPKEPILKKLSNQDYSKLSSICTKILIQINNKLGGITYNIENSKQIQNKNIMAIGIEINKKNNFNFEIGMCSTTNKNFNKYYNSDFICENDKYIFNIANFVNEAINEYKKINNHEPGNILIYRHGNNIDSKKNIENEIKEIEKKNEGIKFYYIIVHTKSALKFFTLHSENKKTIYENPDKGFIVLNGVTHKNNFEFYIQTNKNQDDSSITNYHVYYGNLDFFEFIPLITFNLCHIYANCFGAIRVPNVLKNAEKLLKMFSIMKKPLNDNLKEGQSYL